MKSSATHQNGNFCIASYRVEGRPGQKNIGSPLFDRPHAIVIDGVGCWPDHIRILRQAAHPPGWKKGLGERTKGVEQEYWQRQSHDNRKPREHRNPYSP